MNKDSPSTSQAKSSSLSSALEQSTYPQHAQQVQQIGFRVENRREGIEEKKEDGTRHGLCEHFTSSPIGPNQSASNTANSFPAPRTPNSTHYRRNDLGNDEGKVNHSPQPSCCVSSPGSKSVEDAETKTTTTVTTTTLTSSPFSNTTTREYHRHKLQHREENQRMYTFLNEMDHCDSMPPLEAVTPGVSLPIPFPHSLQHNQFASDHRHPDNVEISYFRVAYRGVVALLSAPDEHASRNGAYLSYGEIFCTYVDSESDVGSRHIASRDDEPRREEELGEVALETKLSTRTSVGHEAIRTSDDERSNSPYLNNYQQNARGPRIPSLPHQNNSNSTHSSACNLLLRGVIRVDSVLSGGWMVESLDSDCPRSDGKTPKRSNAFSCNYVPVTDCIHSKATPSAPHNKGIGFLLVRKQNIQIVEPLKTIPRAEPGHFQYKVISEIPIPILTGPALDAPRTKALLLPGTMHEVSLRLCVNPDAEDTVCFLRLKNQRGWISDRRTTKRRFSMDTTFSVVQEVSVDPIDADEASIVSSIAVSSVSAPSVGRRRHRPPRRRGKAEEKTLPRQIGEPSATAMMTPVKNSRTSTSLSDSLTDKILTPTSNLSLLSDDDESLGNQQHNTRLHQHRKPAIHRHHPTSPDSSYASSTARSSTVNHPHSLMLPKVSQAASLTSKKSSFYLIRVKAPRGLKILDNHKFQIDRLIHGGGNQSNSHVSSSLSVSSFDSRSQSHNAIFQTMPGRTTNGPAIFDPNSKSRILPKGVLFEACRRMEPTCMGGAYNSHQGAGLIKLSDNSGWAICPKREELESQLRYSRAAARISEGEIMQAFEEVGVAHISGECERDSESNVWVRILPRTGLGVACPPASAPVTNDGENDESPSSRGSSSAVGGSNPGLGHGPLTSNDSDVASSVSLGSSFLDAMFRTPKKDRHQSTQEPQIVSRPTTDGHHPENNVIPCGMVVQVENWFVSDIDDRLGQHPTPAFARLSGGQGWIPLSLSNKQVSVRVHPPESRFGSFWFRVQSRRGIKVRLGPSRRAPSIKSDEGVYFRFECGEFLRASEVLTIFDQNGEPQECFAKLYRNRHIRLRDSRKGFRPLSSLTVEAEWVQVYSDNELFLEECAQEPRIERHKQGWRYEVAPESGVPVRRGPSFSAEKADITLFGGEGVVVNERVCPAGERITWLRLKNGSGWVHDISDEGESIMISRTFRERSVLDRPQKAKKTEKEEIAYNTIIARLFHNDTTAETYRASINRSVPKR